VIVTLNPKHFEPGDCLPYDVDVQTPDDFLVHAYYLSPARFLASFDNQVAAAVCIDVPVSPMSWIWCSPGRGAVKRRV